MSSLGKKSRRDNKMAKQGYCYKMSFGRGVKAKNEQTGRLEKIKEVFFVDENSLKHFVAQSKDIEKKIKYEKNICE